MTDKIARQMRKYKTRLLRRHRPRKEDIRHIEEQILHPEPIEEDEHHEHTVVRTERYPVKPMFVDEAVLQLNVRPRQLFVFMNARANAAGQRPLPAQKRRFRPDRAVVRLTSRRRCKGGPLGFNLRAHAECAKLQFSCQPLVRFSLGNRLIIRHLHN